jgi:hypothetical protein
MEDLQGDPELHSRAVAAQRFRMGTVVTSMPPYLCYLDGPLARWD